MLFHSIESVLSVYFIIALGYFLTKKGVFTSDTGGQFAWLVVNITFPCYIIAALPEQFTSKTMIASLYGIGIAFASILSLYPISYLMAKILKLNRECKHVFVAMVVFSNVVYIGLPVSSALFGDISVGYVLQFYVANTFIFWTFGIFFLQMVSYDNSKPKINLKMTLNPPLIAAGIAIILVMQDMQAPFIIKNSLRLIGNMTTPLATLFIGIVFSEIKFKDFMVLKDMFAVVLGRFVFAPAIVYIFFMFINAAIIAKEVFFILAK